MIDDLKELNFVQQGKREMWVNKNVGVVFAEYFLEFDKTTKGKHFYLCIRDLGGVIFHTSKKINSKKDLELAIELFN